VTCDTSRVVGDPFVLVIGVVVLALVAVPVTSTWVGSLVTVAHEGGHLVVAVLSGRNPQHFLVNERKGGGSTTAVLKWGVTLPLVLAAGYLTPPLAGLAGAALVVAGKSWSLLWVAIILLLGAWAKSQGLFTGLIVLLAGAGVGYVAVEGSPQVQSVLAVALVWLMLLGGVRSLVNLGLGADKSDTAQLSAATWIPRVVWAALFWVVALVCLWFGARLLVGV